MAARPHRRISGRLVIATHNPGKLAEMRELLALYGIEAVSAGELGLPEPEETGTTLSRQCAHQGARRRRALPACRPSRTIPASRSMRSTASPASIRRAGPAPPRISPARWRASTRCCASAARSTPAQRKAHFVSALCVAWPDGHVEEFEATVDGTLVWPPRGHKGFGYDPMFLPDGFALTFGEMTSDEKHGLPPKGKGPVAPRPRLPPARGGLP